MIAIHNNQTIISRQATWIKRMVCKLG